MISHSEVKLNLFLISCPPAPLLHCQLFQFQFIIKYSPCLECCFLCLRLKPVHSSDSHSYIPKLNSLIFFIQVQQNA